MKRLLILCALAMVLFSQTKAFAQGANTMPLETLIWTYTDFKQLRENAAEWHDKKGIDGFIFCFVNEKGPPRWDSGAAVVKDYYSELPQTVTAISKAGIKANFVHAGMDDPTWDWFNEERLAKTVETFRELAIIAKNAGCRGVAIDSEAYSGSKMWDPRSYPEDKRSLLPEQIRKTSTAIAKAIMEGYPEAEILLLPEGGYIAMENSPGGELVYEHWIHFFNGMASVKPAKGITIMCEMSYHWTDVWRNAIMVGKLRGFVQAKTDDAMYWRAQCNIAVGSAILDDPKTKKSSFSPEEFGKQWEILGNLSSRYRWIFASESGFAQLPEKEYKPGTTHVKGFYLPLAEDADKYFFGDSKFAATIGQSKQEIEKLKAARSCWSGPFFIFAASRKSRYIALRSAKRIF